MGTFDSMLARQVNDHMSAGDDAEVASGDALDRLVRVAKDNPEDALLDLYRMLKSEGVDADEIIELVVFSTQFCDKFDAAALADARDGLADIGDYA